MPDRPATRAEALGFARRVTAISRRELGEELRSVILHGSLVFDDYRPGHSDVDLLVIVKRPLDDAQIARLADIVVAEQTAAPARLDLRVVTEAAAANPSEAPPMELYVRLGSSPSPEIERRRPGEPDLLAEFSVCRESGQTLAGPPPSELIGQVPRRWIVSYGDALLAGWQSLTEDAAHAELMVLTACRVWRFCEEGVHCSKSAAGAWALGRDPALRAVREALTQRNVDGSQPVDPAGIGRLLRTVRAALARVVTTRRDAATAGWLCANLRAGAEPGCSAGPSPVR